MPASSWLWANDKKGEKGEYMYGGEMCRRVMPPSAD